MRTSDEGRSNAAHWYERAQAAEAKLAASEVERDKLQVRVDTDRALYAELINQYKAEIAAGRRVLAHDKAELQANLAASKAEIAELKAELEATKMVMRGHRLRFNASEAMREDAERYRWLRGDTCQDHSQRWTQWEIRCWNAPRWTDDLRRSDLDNAIDAAIAADKPKEPTL